MRSGNKPIDGLKKELLDFCRSDSLSEDGLREIIIERCGAPKNPDITDYAIFHEACRNELVTEGILRLLLEYFPNAATLSDEEVKFTPLHNLCQHNKNVTLGMVKLLIDAFPESLRRANNDGYMPLHGLCLNENLNEEAGLEILKYFFERCPESVQQVTRKGNLPLHPAVGFRSPEFCRILIDAYPESVRTGGNRGLLPLHVACQHNAVPDIVQLLIDASPDSLRDTDDVGFMPLHNLCANERTAEVVALEIMKLLIEKCPQSVRHADEDGDLPIHIACQGSKSLEFCRMLIEAYPGSERITNREGSLPFHEACVYNTLATVKYLYKLYPEGNVAGADGICPIHRAVWGLKGRSNPSEGIEVIQFLMDDNPDALSVFGQMPLGIACGHQNENLTLDIVQLLIEAFPDSLRHVDKHRYTPLHDLCENKKLDEDIALEVLKLLIEKTPESVRQTSTKGNLPIHLAAETRSPEFCRILIEAYPGSERMPNSDGALPFHWACQRNTLSTVKYLYKLYPESISVANDGGSQPIHSVIWGLECREGNPEAAVEVARFLLDCNTDVALQKFQDELPLYLVCDDATSDKTPKLNAYLETLQLLYDAYPEAIKEGMIESDFDNFCQEVQTFINTQLACARQARDHRVMTTPDESGQLPLHRAVRDNVTLGSIKLLVAGNSSALRHADNRGMIPLHVACQHHHSPSVVEYMIGQNSSTLKMKDLCQNTLLHFACRGANHVMIAFLLEKYDAAFVSTRNSHKQLPIDLLFDSEAVSDREGIEYMESIYRLIRANPETLMGCDMNTNEKQQDQSDNRKKRKIDDL